MKNNDFNKGIEWCLSENFNRKMIIDLAKEKFSFSVVGKQYKEFLNNITL